MVRIRVLSSIFKICTNSRTKGRTRTMSRNCISALKRKATLKLFANCTVLVIILHCVIRFEQIREHGDYGTLDLPITEKDLVDYPPLGLTVPETFPETGTPRMPKIIHQTWKNTEIPRKLIKWVKSWEENHPGWEYWLWTDASARKLISERHPNLLPIYDGYSENIRRADALRYVILYEFGGVYADMDLESLKPLDPMLLKYACFASQEPYEHPILYGNFEHLVINALLGCRAKHPFMKLLVDNLPYFSHMWNVLDSTGPHFVTSLYKRYTENTSLAAIHDDAIYLAPAEYFFPTIDPSKHFWFRYQCFRFEKLSHIQKQACVNLKYYGVRRKPLPMSFTDHHWIHTYLDLRVSLKGPVDIHSFMSKVYIYKDDENVLSQ